jgi:cellulose synthase/poly-beta-1,6-N-acetylglucosamine synthase-like glycosyltransferase
MFYHWLLQILSTNKKEKTQTSSNSELPYLTVIMSVYNEEAILTKKIDSILASNYPKEKLKIIVGSDASTDKTNSILQAYEAKVECFKAHIFDDRQGKPALINKLVGLSESEILIMTDAKVIFHPDTVRLLAAHFLNPSIGIVGGNILKQKIEKDGVSIQEQAFMSREILMKYREGLIWGSTVGVYGAIYALRKELYTVVPAGYAVDDFFISMNVLRKNKKAILDINSITYEDVPNLLSEEYRRKVRISTGNYRNMGFFFRELLTPWKGASFAYISHKVIRWLGPFLLLAFMLSNIFLFNTHEFYKYAMFGWISILLLPIIDFFLSKIGIHVVFLRFVRHFITMNIALLHGFINNLGGIRKDVWQPTNR